LRAFWDVEWCAAILWIDDATTTSVSLSLIKCERMKQTYFLEHAASPADGALSKHGEYLTPVGGLPARLSLQFPG
jgi:hypothetical protein